MAIAANGIGRAAFAYAAHQTECLGVRVSAAVAGWTARVRARVLAAAPALPSWGQELDELPSLWLQEASDPRPAWGQWTSWAEEVS